MESIRTEVFEPFIEGMGPKFRLEMYDTYEIDYRGQTKLAFKLWQDHELIFEDSGFCCSPLHADDSDESVRALMTFLCLRPGDTDKEYFDNYTPRQMEFAKEYGETLGYEVECRFPEEEYA